ncbi:MAG: MFS transporter [Bryobacterales bacterium]|nr:MFS transporter [Acidobacteriota bacterium]MCB9384850.1 MFS transporter [Bryobacterales bacterium]
MSATTSTTTAAASSSESALERMRWPVVILLSLGMVIAYFDRVNLSVALPSMAGGFDWSETQQGMALSAIFWTYTALQIPSGYLVDRFGVRTPYLIGFLLWSLASAATALTTGLAALIAIRMLVGVGESVVTPASMRYIRLHFDEKQRGLAVGLYMTGTKVGPALGLPISAYLVSEYGWQPMFLMIGAVSLVWLVPWLLWVKKDDVAAQPGSSAAVKKATGGAKVSAGAILKTPLIWGILLGTYCYMYFVYYCMTWMPTYFKQEYGMSVKEMGWYGGVSFGGMAAVAALAGYAADVLIRRGWDPVNVRKGFTIAGFCMAATQTIGAFTTNVDVMLFFAVFSLCGLGLATANYWALTQTLIPGGSIALVVGIQNTAANLAGIVAPWLTGFLIERTGAFDAPVKAVGVWLVLGIASYVFLVREKYAPVASEA